MTAPVPSAVAVMAAILDSLPQICSRDTTELATALSAAGYRIVKDNPTVAELAAEQGVTPFDPATFVPFDPPLIDAERDGLTDALAELHQIEPPWAVRVVGFNRHPNGTVSSEAIYGPFPGYASADAWLTRNRERLGPVQAPQLAQMWAPVNEGDDTDG